MVSETESPTVRDASPADVAGITQVAALVEQDHEWAGGDERYLSHLLTHGRVVVAENDGRLVGYAATRRVENREGTVSVLCDLFVAPGQRGNGIGRAMLSALWCDRSPRLTFSSTHPRALPLYTSFGLSAWWPLLYLVGEPARLRPSAGYAVETVGAEEAARLERRWTGAVRDLDYAAWLGRPGGGAVVVRRDGRAVAVGAVGGQHPTLEHLRLATDADDATASAAVHAALSHTGDGSPARTHLPAPHPAVAGLLDAGWRVEEFDLFMSTHAGLLDPTRDVPSPALA